MIVDFVLLTKGRQIEFAYNLLLENDAEQRAHDQRVKLGDLQMLCVFEVLFRGGEHLEYHLYQEKGGV